VRYANWQIKAKEALSTFTVAAISGNYGVETGQKEDKVNEKSEIALI